MYGGAVILIHCSMSITKTGNLQRQSQLKSATTSWHAQQSVSNLMQHSQSRTVNSCGKRIEKFLLYHYRSCTFLEASLICLAHIGDHLGGRGGGGGLQRTIATCVWKICHHMPRKYGGFCRRLGEGYNCWTLRNFRFSHNKKNIVEDQAKELWRAMCRMGHNGDIKKWKWIKRIELPSVFLWTVHQRLVVWS